MSQRKYILVIEDNPIMGMLFEENLKGVAGLTVLLAADMDEGRDLFKLYQNEIALAIVDMQVPDSSGPHNTSGIRFMCDMRAQAPSIPAVLCSADMEPARAALVEAGFPATSCFSKDSLNQLPSFIHRLLNRTPVTPQAGPSPAPG